MLYHGTLIQPTDFSHSSHCVDNDIVSLCIFDIMYVCVCVCVCVCVYACSIVLLCIHGCVGMYGWVFCTYVHVSLCVSVCAQACLHVCAVTVSAHVCDTFPGEMVLDA